MSHSFAGCASTARSIFPTFASQNEFPDIGYHRQLRTFLVAPLRQQGEFIGVLNARRIEVRPFTPAQIKLLETFADQAVIALENVRLFQELKESLEQQTATSEILGVIASSPTDIQPVLDTVAKNAARLCEAADAQIRLIETDRTRLVASFGSLSAPEFVSISPLNPGGRAILTRETLHVHDLQERKDEFPESQALRRGLRTFLSAPMIREGMPIGVINIRRMEVRPFSERHVKLLETFASQAVIAIENVRLFQELKESLEQQTATSEILGVIASSPTDIQPVLDVVAENAARLCDATDAVIHRIDGDELRTVANYGPLPGRPGEGSGIPLMDRRSIPGRTVIDGRTLHIHDLAAEPEDDLAAPFARGLGVRTVLATPLLREGIPIGAIHIRRMEVRPFTEKQIKLLETFAAQAVIAIENVRLFQELKESLEQQTATSEILGVIASSPNDLTPVLEIVAKNAAQLCEASSAQVFRTDGDLLRLAANYGALLAGETRPISRGTVAGRAVIERRTIHTTDPEQAAAEFPESRSAGGETRLATPLLQDGVAVGVIGIRRTDMRPFTESQIKLVETFAKQAVIAIENVRLFQELKESLEQQTATSEILGVIASSPTDIQPVLDAVAEKRGENYVTLLSAFIQRVDGECYETSGGLSAYPAPLIGEDTVIDRGRLSGRAIIEEQTIHIHDHGRRTQSRISRR